jgi:hypothetical protein
MEELSPLTRQYKGELDLSETLSCLNTTNLQILKLPMLIPSEPQSTQAVPHVQELTNPRINGAKEKGNKNLVTSGMKVYACGHKRIVDDDMSAMDVEKQDIKGKTV